MSDDNKNPYAPPRSDVTPPPLPVGNQELLAEPRSLPMGAGIAWLSESWGLVKNNLGVWVLITLAWFAFQIVLGIIPGVGDVISAVLNPVLTGGVLLGIRATDMGEKMRFDYLFEGFKQKFAPLAGLGGITLGVLFLFGLIVGGAFVGMNMDNLEANTLDVNAIFSGVNMGLVGVGVVLLIFVMLLFYFATQLVALNDVPVLKALTLSLKGCLHNPLPLLVYWLALVVVTLLGVLPLMLGLLVVIPWMFASMYVSYKQVFLK
jgi:uncharacterized membrane protein